MANSKPMPASDQATGKPSRRNTMKLANMPITRICSRPMITATPSGLRMAVIPAIRRGHESPWEIEQQRAAARGFGEQGQGQQQQAQREHALENETMWQAAWRLRTLVVEE